MSDETSTPSGDTPVMSLEDGTKGLLQSATIRNVFYALMASAVGFLLQHQPELVTHLLDWAPDSIDPFVEPTISWVMQILILIFGVRSMQGRVAVGDIKGLYKK